MNMNSRTTVPTLASAAVLAMFATLWAALPGDAVAADPTPVAAPAAAPAPAPAALPAPTATPPAAKPLSPVASPVLPSSSGNTMSSPVTVPVPLIAPNDDYLSQLAELQRKITLEEKEKELRELKVKTEQLQADYEEAVRKRREAANPTKPVASTVSGDKSGGLGGLSGLFGNRPGGSDGAAGERAPTTSDLQPADLTLPGNTNTAGAGTAGAGTTGTITLPPVVTLPPPPPPPPPAPRAAKANVAAVRGVGEAMTADVILEDGSVITVKAGDRIPSVGTVSKISNEGVFIGGGKRASGKRLPFSNSVPTSGDSMGDLPGLPMPPMDLPFSPTSSVPNMQLPGAGQMMGQPNVPPGGQMFDGEQGGTTQAR